ncbi:murein biosynthesis integral membrane protein MurJ [Candidatus Viridilinea mediisalina]|uniref:Probable lipid II flippase MurJ n=1 Tax=Candidatus Viridilinea mediisalina TaxID=2024553 RepID=A0A2A6RP02_9CHLR|nr:murein biosynthesis integral membrane protein MurJ [Candidatus Viridilinea mediisalina]PDW04646.1 murein biosynthesis integral membrane protein MurJ [Candidatus Viridilinea mediisalina]
MANPDRAFRSVAVAALLIAFGNIASRLVGFIREPTIAFFFARGVEVDAFQLAWTVPSTIYDLLIAGAVSAALVPVFAEYAEGERDEFWRVVSGVLSIALAALTALTALTIWQAPLLIALLAGPQQAELRELATPLVRWLMPAVLLMGFSGLATAVLHAQQRFLLPAFTMVVFNLGMVLGVVLLHQQLGINSLAVGALLGALGQVALQLPGLRDARLRLHWGQPHPAVRRILWLYAPVALGIAFSVLGTLIDRRLAAGFEAALSTMRYATTLIQLPLGLVASAVALAVLPTLSRQNAVADEANFRATLAMGLKVVLLLIMPATAGLAVLAEPVVALVFQRGAFGAEDSAATALALLLYLPGLPAAALDQVLIFAFYARKNTLTPNLIQGAAIGCYVLVALPLLWLSELGFLALVLGNSAQWIGHALLTYLLLTRVVPLGGLRLGEAALKGLVAASVMALAVSSLIWLVGPQAPWVVVLLGGSLGAMVYALLCRLLRIEAFDFFVGVVRARIAAKRA